MTHPKPNQTFTYQYAIRMPNGELHTPPRESALFGRMFGVGPDNSDAPPTPRVWDSRAEAEAYLCTLRTRAAAIGIADWFGVIVQRVCSPFTHADPGEHFAAEVQVWLDEQ